MLSKRPLDGIRVLDLTRVLAGPFCTMNLADLGAEVIKIELPGRGDDSRSFAPTIPGTTDSGYFFSVNRGKKSVTLDLRNAAGAEVFIDLVKRADVVVENFAPTTIERFGLGFDRMRGANRGIILCSISGFGQSGPMAATAAYDIVAQAIGGTMSITGYPGGDPLRCGVSIGDLAAALYAMTAIFAALRVRERTGEGQHLDIAMLDCQVALLEDAMARYSASGKVPGPIGTRHPSITPFQQFRAADGFFVIGVGNESLWKRFCKGIGRDDLTGDPRFATNPSRTANHPELEQILADHFRARPRDEWLKVLGEAGVPSAPVNNLAEVARYPQLLERQMVLHADHPKFPDLLVPGSPLKSVGEASIPNTRAPDLGEHTDEVLSEFLGYSAARIAHLRADGVI